MKIIRLAKPGKIMNQPHGENPSNKLDSQIFLEKEDPQHAAKKKRKKKSDNKPKEKECKTCVVAKKKSKKQEEDK